MQINEKMGENGDRLSWGDTVFLHLEREGMPLNVACVCVFQGEILFKDCLQFVESKLPLIPRYLKRVVPPPLNIGLPSWEFDPTFDIHRHLREVTLKHGTDTELKTLAGKILSTVMDRQHPLWDLTLVHGLKGERTGLIFRLHHCLADGIAGVGIMNVLMDASPVAPRLPRRKVRLRVPPPRDVLTSITNGCVDSYSDFVKRILAAMADLSSMAERFAGNGGKLATDEFASLLPELSAPTERLRFNIHIVVRLQSNGAKRKRGRVGNDALGHECVATGILSFSANCISAVEACPRMTPLPASTTGDAASEIMCAAFSIWFGAAPPGWCHCTSSGWPSVSIQATSSGISMCVAPGFSDCASLKALRKASGMMSGVGRLVFHLVTGRNSVTTSRCWCDSLCIRSWAA